MLSVANIIASYVLVIQWIVYYTGWWLTNFYRLWASNFRLFLGKCVHIQLTYAIVVRYIYTRTRTFIVHNVQHSTRYLSLISDYATVEHSSLKYKN